MTKQQTKLIEALIKKWESSPDERFGQLLYNYTRFGTGEKLGFIRDIFHYQDEDILTDLKQSNENL